MRSCVRRSSPGAARRRMTQARGASTCARSWRWGDRWPPTRSSREAGRVLGRPRRTRRARSRRSRPRWSAGDDAAARVAHGARDDALAGDGGHLLAAARARDGARLGARACSRAARPRCSRAGCWPRSRRGGAIRGAAGPRSPRCARTIPRSWRGTSSRSGPRPRVPGRWRATCGARCTTARATAAAGRRAAQAALTAGEPEVALALVRARGRGDAPRRACGAAAPPSRSPRSVSSGAPRRRRSACRRRIAYLDDALRADLARPLVSAWLRAGNVERARRPPRRAGALDDDQTIGWLALYDGDLVGGAAPPRARHRARRGAHRRARRARPHERGAARGTGRGLPRAGAPRHRRRRGALRGRSPTACGDAAPALLATAARLATQSGNADRSLCDIGRGSSTQHAAAPEVPEALLELARALRARAASCRPRSRRYESLLIDHPGSAMVPQARRELEQAARTYSGGASERAPSARGARRARAAGAACMARGSRVAPRAAQSLLVPMDDAQTQPPQGVRARPSRRIKYVRSAPSGCSTIAAGRFLLPDAAGPPPRGRARRA